MREILFRGKQKNNREWIEGGLVHQTMFYGDAVDCYHIISPGEFHCDYYDSAEVIPETVGQFTGLTDKNGKRIFEGDIVRVRYDSNDGEECEIQAVTYNSKECCYYPMAWVECCDYCDAFLEFIEIEVIGNIHDNPELLGGVGDG